MKRILDKSHNWSEAKVQLILTVLCKTLGIPNLIIIPLDIEKEDKFLGLYEGKMKDGSYYTSMKNESDLHTALHELAHHVQSLGDYWVVTPHDHTFTSSIGRVRTAIRKTFGKESFPYPANALRWR